MKLKILACVTGVAMAVATSTTAAVIGITEGKRDLVENTTVATPKDSSSNPAAAFDLDGLGSLGADSFEIYGRIVNAIDNYSFGFTSTSSFNVSWIFGGYTLDGGGFVSDSGFVSESVGEKTATFSLLDADNGFAVVDSLTFTTDITSGPAVLFNAGPGSYVLQIDGEGEPNSLIGLYDLEISAVPLPASAFFLLAGLAGFGIAGRRKAA